MRHAIALATLATLAAAPAALAADARTMTVRGHAEAGVPVTAAVIDLGIHREGPDAASATRAAGGAGADLLAALRGAGVADADVRTTTYALGPVEPRDGTAKTAPHRFALDVGYAVRVSPAERAGEVLSAALSHGADLVGGVDYEAVPDASVRDGLREAAVEDARRAAERYASAAGVGLGRVTSIAPSGAPYPVARPVAPMRAMAVAAPPPRGGAATAVEDVDVTYELVDR